MYIKCFLQFCTREALDKAIDEKDWTWTISCFPNDLFNETAITKKRNYLKDIFYGIDFEINNTTLSSNHEQIIIKKTDSLKNRTSTQQSANSYLRSVGSGSNITDLTADDQDIATIHGNITYSVALTKALDSIVETIRVKGEVSEKQIECLDNAYFEISNCTSDDFPSVGTLLFNAGLHRSNIAYVPKDMIDVFVDYWKVKLYSN